MNNESNKNLIRLLTIALIISFASILFLANRYLELVDRQTTYIITTQPINTRPILPAPIGIQTNVAPSSTASAVSDWHKYQNSVIGFGLQFPDTWQGYAVTALNSATTPSAGFSFKDPHQPFTIFQIIHYTKIQWNALKNNTMTKLSTRPDGSVVACDGCCTITSDSSGGGQFDQFQVARCKEVPSILKTLKVTK